MTCLRCDGFREIWAVDFEFSALGGGLPVPVCAVARSSAADGSSDFGGQVARATSAAVFHRARFVDCSLPGLSGVRLSSGTELADA